MYQQLQTAVGAFFYHFLIISDSYFLYEALHLQNYELKAIESTCISENREEDDQDHGYVHYNLGHKLNIDNKKF